MAKQTYTAKEAAAALGISVDTLRRWDKAGKLRVERDAGNHRVVAASEIERVIAMVPGVAEVAVVAMDHPMLDETPAAFVIPAEGQGPELESAIAAACEASLASFKRPHLIRLVDALDSYRDLLTSLMDVYLSTVSNRLNGVMKQLTLIATIFLPLTFITGFFGQNFGWMVDHVDSAGAFWGLGIGLEVFAVAAFVVWFRRSRARQ